jgi:hypothetical protein
LRNNWPTHLWRLSTCMTWNMLLWCRN